jgi:hypothetical protein
MTTNIDVSVGTAVVDIAVSLPTEEVAISASVGTINVELGVVAGTLGPQGPQGFQGSQGFQGEIGPTDIYATDNGTPPPSPQYLWLDEAATGNGTQGPQGFQGIQGAQGNQGHQGSQGNQGIPGTPILAGSGISIDTTTEPGYDIINVRSGYQEPTVVSNKITIGAVDDSSQNPIPLTGSLVQAPTEGNLQLAVFSGTSYYGTVSWSGASDYTTIFEEISPPHGYYVASMWMVWRVVGADEPATFNLGTVTGLDAVKYAIYEIEGADLVDPIGGYSYGFVQPTGGVVPTSQCPFDNQLLVTAAEFAGYAGPSGNATIAPNAIPSTGSTVLYQYGYGVSNYFATYTASSGLLAEVATGLVIPQPSVQVPALVGMAQIKGVPTPPVVLPPTIVQSVTAGSGISVTGTAENPVVSNTAQPIGDSRLMLFMLTPNTPLPNGTWIIVGEDTAPWVLQNASASAGSDLILNADGKTIDVATTGTYMVRLAFQYTSYQGSNQVRFASGASSVGGNFPGWIAGDPDPLTIATAQGQNGDYIGNYCWRIAAGGSFTIALGAWGNTANESLDGVEMDIVRIA